MSRTIDEITCEELWRAMRRVSRWMYDQDTPPRVRAELVDAHRHMSSAHESMLRAAYLDTLHGSK